MMFHQYSSKVDSREKGGPGTQVTVVRTESQIARFNNARALFEKMSEKKGEGFRKPHFQTSVDKRNQANMCNRSLQKVDNCSSLQKSQSLPIPTLSSSKPNGLNISQQSFSSNVSHSDISEKEYMFTSSNSTDINRSNYSSMTNISKSTTSPVRNLSFETNLVSTSTAGNGLQNLCKNGDNKYNNNKAGSNDMSCSSFSISDNKSSDNIHLTSSSERNRVIDVAATFDKPIKPVKPENITDKCLSSHLQNQRIIQRHKNWFQMFSKNKSPSSPTRQCHSPVKTISSQPLKSLENLSEPRNHSNVSNEGILDSHGSTLSGLSLNKSLDSYSKTANDITQPCCWSSVQYTFTNAHSYSKAFGSCGSTCSSSQQSMKTQNKLISGSSTLREPKLNSSSQGGCSISSQLANSESNSIITKPPESAIPKELLHNQEEYLEKSGRLMESNLFSTQNNVTSTTRNQEEIMSQECDDLHLISKDQPLEASNQMLSVNDIVSEESNSISMSPNGVENAVLVSAVSLNHGSKSSSHENQITNEPQKEDKTKLENEKQPNCTTSSSSNSEFSMKLDENSYMSKSEKVSNDLSDLCEIKNENNECSFNSSYNRSEEAKNEMHEISRENYTSSTKADDSAFETQDITHADFVKEKFSSSKSADKVTHFSSFASECENDSNNYEKKTINAASTSSKDEARAMEDARALEWQSKRREIEEEERLRREKDRLEIEKTKRRIMELKKEKEQMRRSQAAQLKSLMGDCDQGSDEGQAFSECQSKEDLVPSLNPEPDTAKKCEDDQESSSEIPESSHFEFNAKDDSLVCDSTSHSFDVVKNEDAELGICHAKRVESTEVEEIEYDHTVRSAQHEFQACAGEYFERLSGQRDVDSVSLPSCEATSTVSSSHYEALPPPIPPHHVDPAVLNEQLGIPITPSVSSLMSGSSPEDVHPHSSTPYLETGSQNNQCCTDSVVLMDVENQLIVEEVNMHHSLPPPPYVEAESSNNGEEPQQIFEEGFLTVGCEEVLVEDGVHYFSDGNFWTEIPGLGDAQEDEFMPPEVEIHKHTKITFSTAPIKLFSTHSVTEYDRKNDDVDPVAASAEYELEKRVEKMDVFPVQIQKGERGLGLSIIGMGVGADAGVEKLGIFVKTITPGGATDSNGQIQVNDQIIEVDEQSLVGVTQAFAASVLKSTAGVVHFLIGREKDPENSEVAMLIQQSLQADNEREDRRRAFEASMRDSSEQSLLREDGEFSPPADNSIGSPNEDFFGDCNSPPYVASPPYPGSSARFQEQANADCQTITEDKVADLPSEAFNLNVCSSAIALTSSGDSITSQQLEEAKCRNEVYEEEITFLRAKIEDLERELGAKSDEFVAANRGRELENQLQLKQESITKYQSMLEQSQSQYGVLEKKYCKAKKIIKEYQNRERDFLHREEYHISQLEEKDVLYNSLVKALKDRVIQLESDLAKMQRDTGMMSIRSPSVASPTSPTGLNATGELHSSPSKVPPRMDVPNKPSFLGPLDGDLSEGEIEDASSGSKSNTIERKEFKEDLDVAVPPTELLDNSFSKAKGELAARGGLAKRQLPSLKKTASASSVDLNGEECLSKSPPEAHSEPIMAPPTINPPAVVYKNSASSSLPPSSTQEISDFRRNDSNTSYLSHQSNVNTRAPPPPYQSGASLPLSTRIPAPVEAFEMPPTRHQPPIARVQPVNRVDASPMSSRSYTTASSEFVPFYERTNVTMSSSNITDSDLLSKRIHSGSAEVAAASHVAGSTHVASARVASTDARFKGIPLSATTSRFHATQREAFEERSTIAAVSSPEDENKTGNSSFEYSFEAGRDCRTSVFDWTQEQVAQWLVLHGLESCVPTFVSAGVTGPRLVNIDAKELKSFNLVSEDKTKLKKKIKELRQNLEKERKILEKENKEREKLQKKAEKLAEKAEKRRK